VDASLFVELQFKSVISFLLSDDGACLLCAGLDPVHYMILLDSKYAANMIRESEVQLGNRGELQTLCQWQRTVA